MIVQRLVVHISTIVYSQVFIHVAEWTGAMYNENSCPRFHTAVQASNLSCLSRESKALPHSCCSYSVQEHSVPQVFVPGTSEKCTNSDTVAWHQDMAIGCIWMSVWWCQLSVIKDDNKLSQNTILHLFHMPSDFNIFKFVGNVLFCCSWNAS